MKRAPWQAPCGCGGGLLCREHQERWWADKQRERARMARARRSPLALAKEAPTK